MNEIRYRHELGKLLSLRNLPRRVAEVGVAEGRFSLEILAWDLERLYLVDAWASEPTRSGDSCEPQEWHDANRAWCERRVAPFMDRITVLRGLSHEMAAEVPDASLGLVHLDACHEEAFVARDLEAWWPKLVPGGIMSGHDYLNPAYGVETAANAFAARMDLAVNVIPDHGPVYASFWIAND